MSVTSAVSNNYKTNPLSRIFSHPLNFQSVTYNVYWFFQRLLVFSIPVVETSEAETTVNVKDGVTIIIGGLIKEETINTTKKVPFLGSIPILGMAFRSTNNSTSKTEIVIFLTPRIVSGDIGDQEQLVAF